MTTTEARRLNTLAVLEALREPALRALLVADGADPRVVGKWVWIEFDHKPSREVREQLKALGFRYNAKREAWQHACGVFRRFNPRNDPRDSYGQQRVVLTDDVAAVA